MVLYNYGGLIAQALPEYDRVAYPHAYMAENAVMEGAYALFISDQPFIYDSANNVIVPTEGAVVLRAAYYNDAWGEFAETDATELLVAQWTNTDIQNTEGEVFLEATEPVVHQTTLEVVHKVRMDIGLREILPVFYMMEGDKYCRKIAFILYDHGQPVNIHTGTAAVIRYQKPTGMGDKYSTIKEDTQAYSFDGNTLTVTLDADVCSVPGNVMLAVTIVTDQTELNTFALRLVVEKNPWL